MGNNSSNYNACEVIHLFDDDGNGKMYYFKEPSENATSHLICNCYCFNPNCGHGKFGPLGKLGPDHPYIANAYYTDDNGNIVGYNFKSNNDICIPDVIQN